MGQIKYPKGEKVWVKYYDSQKNLQFIISSKESNRSVYFLYKFTNGEFNKLGKSRSPKELEDRFVSLEKLLEGSEN